MKTKQRSLEAMEARRSESGGHRFHPTIFDRIEVARASIFAASSGRSCVLRGIE